MTQIQEIFNYLNQGNSISPLEALEKFGCFRLSGRIYDLRQQGYNIQMTMVKNNGKRFASYRLIRQEKQLVMPL